MKAALYDRYGGPDVFYEGIVPLPVRKTGEILVRVHAAGVNSIDTVARAGKLRLFTGGKVPHRTGLDFAGEVAAVPAMMSDLQVGDRVWGALPRGKWGSAAEFVSVPEDCVAHIPKDISFELAAALPTVGTTALMALRDVAKIRRGERLLIRGASGGVGMSAVQIGKAFDAKITGLASAANLPFVRELGADRAVDYAAAVPSGLGLFDVILDTVGTKLPDYRRLLAPKGRMITLAIDTQAPASALLYIAASYAFGARRVRFFSARVPTPILNDLAVLIKKVPFVPLSTKFTRSPKSAPHTAPCKRGAGAVSRLLPCRDPGRSQNRATTFVGRWMCTSYGFEVNFRFQSRPQTLKIDDLPLKASVPFLGDIHAYSAWRVLCQPHSL